ncbi:MAG: 2TM domain-containing protein [Saprospiraceae bacterium]|nr:2TM domain-containing protein [Lewinella sp.]
MKHEDIEKKAKQRVLAKKGFFITAATFSFVSLILVIVAFIFPFPMMVRFWILFPILVFGFVLGIMYLTIFGIPGSRLLSPEWEEEEKNREIARLYRENGLQLPPVEELSEEDQLELKELDRLRQKWGNYEDYV